MEQTTVLISLRSPFLDNDRVYPALGNLYLKSALKQQGLEARVIDDWKEESFENTSHVGVSIMTPQREDSNLFSKWFKKTHPDKVLIAGGPHAKYYQAELVAEGWDHVVTDDGERALPGIIKGEITDRVITDKLTAKELAQMPRPDRLSEAEYLSGYNYVLGDRNSTTILTARGCCEQCTFCEDAMTLVRKTPIGKVKQELDDIVELGYKGVYIFDDIFALAPKVTYPICDELAERDLIYRCNGQARMMTDEFMKKLADSGCHEIAFGAESGSQTILDNIKKNTQISQNYKFAELTHKYGIDLKLFILLGLPGETRKTLSETEDFIREAKAQDVQVAIYYPYKGTQIRDAIDSGNSLVDLTFNGEGLGAYGQKGGESEYVVRTEDLSSQDLKVFRDHLIRTYRPKSHSAHKTMQRKAEDAFFENK